ncbi:DsbA family protein [Iamia majanohamensis]|uniref:DsbA family protein n=1 Tax=Iamia majanohamensis TaxID=467976 RepID=A0AAE9Y4G2_9ACTN|nr:DsbA family protein [Iamia majanohamensis]WCO65925.1 DsbA family protein [Iamia majanohamensis]
MTAFAVTWDYRCPFARNAHEHVLAGLADGAGWDVTFVPFSLGQVHVEEGQAPIWDRPEEDSGLTALQVGVHVRDTAPEAFRAVHHDLFAARHDHGCDLRDRDVLAKVLADHGLDADAALAAVDDGSLLATIRAEHEAAASTHDVWGVPTFVLGDHAAFVRLMDRPGDDGAHARATVDRVVGLLADAPTINEFKHTSLAR